MSNLKLMLKKYFPKFSYGMYAFKNKDAKMRNLIFQHNKIDLIFDIGAHIGLYGHGVRHNGFSGKIISFEPQSKPFMALTDLAKNDKQWDTENFALGDFDGEAEINISENSVSSSILDVKQSSVDLVPESKVIGKETIQVKKLDTVLLDYYKEGNKLFVKIDAQGFEKNIIEGARNSLDKIQGFQLELPVNSFYEDSESFTEMIYYMYSLGFRLASVESGWHNLKTGEIMEIDGIFLKVD